ncbi:hypothetical protein ACHAWF_013525 [Thalassiosira exigua]
MCNVLLLVIGIQFIHRAQSSFVILNPTPAPSAIAEMARSSDSARAASCAPDERDGLTSYDKLLCRLYTTNLFNAKTEGLKTMETLHRALGSPMDASGARVVHIAGSNGKGSTAFKMARALKRSGYRVGLFSSPHISCFRERIQIDDVPCSEAIVEECLTKVFDLCDDRGIPATFFEVLTAAAFLIFAREKAEVVVLETGLGGRLDATNVIKKPALSVITSIGLEHTKILGDTIPKIALEKGGIIKEGCPVLVGNNVPVEVLRKCAKDRKASQFYECKDLLGKESGGECTQVDYDADNSRTATAALTLLQRNWASDGPERTISPQDVAAGVGMRPKCRFEEITCSVVNTDSSAKVRVILDVAHNPQAIEHLMAKVRAHYPSSRLRIVVGMSADKDLKECSKILLDNVPHPKFIHLVESPNPRCAPIASILEANPELDGCNHKESSVSLQVKEAMKLASVKDELLVVCGSFYIMADAREELGIKEPRDSRAIGDETAKIIQRRQGHSR